MSLTYDEIFGTPDALFRTTEYIEKRWPDIENFFSGKRRFIFLGSGSSYCLARSMSTMTYMHTGLNASALSAGDLLLHAPAYKTIMQDAAVICISRSGQTSEMNMALDAVQSYGIHTAALICADGTPLEERCVLSLNMPWAFDNSVCQTRTVSNFYYAAAYILAKFCKNTTLLEDLKHITNNSLQFLKDIEPEIKKIAALPWTHSAVLADAELEGIADNGSLAFKEICQLPSNSYHVLDSRHGPVVIFGKNTLLIAAIGTKNSLEQNLLSEMKDKGAITIAVSDIPIDMQDISVFSYGRTLSHVALGLPLIMLCQLITYYKASHTGANPDKPSGLSAWVSLK